MEINDIKFRYNPNDNYLISIPRFTIEKSDILFLHGASGCGKTTILNLFSGVIESNYSKVVLKYYNNIDYLMHDSKLLPWYTIEKNFNVECQLRNINADFKLFIFYLEMYNLKGILNKKPKELSLGMKQRIEIAKALSFNPDLLLLDESFSGIDSKTKQIVFKSVLDFVSEKGTTVIATAHQIADQLSIANKIALIVKGKIDEIIDISEPASLRLNKKKEDLLRYSFVQKLID